MMNTQAVVHIRKGEARSLKAGGMWIYDNEIERIEGDFENGDILRVEDFDGYPLGCGFINTRSKLTVRMLSRKKDTVIDDAFIEMRVRNAWEYRRQTVDTSSCRLIFGEADFLPGIVIDKFSDVLVVESLALGIDRLKPLILEKLVKVLEEDGIHIRGIYERSDAKVRLQEGMERYKGFIGEPFDTKVEIVENGVRYLVDVKDGQKTGFFLDQKYNRLAIQRLCPGRVILGDAVCLGQGHEALLIGLHLVQKLLLQFVTALFQGDDLLLHIGILLLAQGEGAHHVAKGRADGAHQGSSTAAAGGRGIGGQDLHKFPAGFHCHIHKGILLCC